jgi:hypothetical protein
MVILVSEASNRYTHLLLVEREFILALIHLKVLLLNNYEISSIYEYPVFGDNHVQSS